MARSFGIAPRLAREQLQKSYDSSPAEPLPSATPGRATAGDVGIATAGNTLDFIVIGDSGGVANSAPQNAVCKALADTPLAADFVYSVGDIVYYNGDPDQWVPQFYEPYCHSLGGIPIVAIPGNHDGDSSDGVKGSGIVSFMANMCTAKPEIPPGDATFEYERHTQTQPYCDWTLNLSMLTIIGVWSNVPSGGVLTNGQRVWLESELKAAPTDRPVIVALHHPPYSVDQHHGGSEKMGRVLDEAFGVAKRSPDLVLSGHVHDYQRFTRDFEGDSITYVVQGNSGYHNLHLLASDAVPGMRVADDVVFDAGFDDEWGYLTLSVTDGQIVGTAYGVDMTGLAVARDTFTI